MDPFEFYHSADGTIMTGQYSQQLLIRFEDSFVMLSSRADTITARVSVGEVRPVPTVPL